MQKSQIQNIHQLLVSKQITCEALIQQKLDALVANDHNSVNFLLPEMALKLARQVDEKIKNGQEIGLLEGIPFGLKDVFLLQGTPATASSDILKNYTSAYTATAIQKLLDAGAIPIVRENCDSFGHGSSSENTVFGAVKNAINSQTVAGGSSGGSAVNVAKGYTVFSIGGDTGGSIRQPAGFNGIYGLKPTYGRISRYGLMAYASSTDCVGPMAKSVEDIAILLNVMSGKDYHDQTTYASTPVNLELEIIENMKAESRKSKAVIGYYKSFLENPALAPAIKADFEATIQKLKADGYEIKELDIFDANILVSTYYTIAMAETASNLSRIDGTNYGQRSQEKSLKEGYAITRSENFTEETKRRIVGGNQVLSAGYSEEIYIKARGLREKISNHFNEDFEAVDIILSPVSTSLPPTIGNNLKNPYNMYMTDAYTVGFSLGGLPTLTVPFGTAIGLQITAAKDQEQRILDFANLLGEM